MNYEAAIALAHQRMREIGKRKDEYHIQECSIVGTAAERAASEITVLAYNEYYFLVGYENYFGLQIFSDSAYFNADDYTYNTTTQEFTGMIKIFQIPGTIWSIDNGGGRIFGGTSRRYIPLDFIRVIIH